jgi:hypothetical protein
MTVPKESKFFLLFYFINFCIFMWEIEVKVTECILLY